MKYLGIDTGGTFTDFVYVEEDSIRIHKVLSTPNAPERAILQGIKDLALELEDLNIIHGSTVATNAVLEGKGARVVYVANRGLKDVLTIGRQARRELYNLQPKKVAPPVEEALCLETGGRLAADGSVVEELSDIDIRELINKIDDLKPEAIAINLLFSFLDGQFETRIRQQLDDRYFISCSHEVLPEYKEYERGITTWLNAYVGPLMQGYLTRLEQATTPASLHVMRSSGQRCQAKQAGKEAVHLLLSGPAGGLSGARYVSGLSGEDSLLSFDMGGTSTDVAMIDGDIVLANQGRIGHYPVAIPMVDIHTIGAGGGSIAKVDEGGAMHVGPESAGAMSGPACYGQGGSQPTVTDANLVLGHLPSTIKLGGSLGLSYEAAQVSLSQLAKDAGLDSAEQAAEGLIQIANENMAKALRVISVERGIDPRNFALVAFGGAGGMHVCALAEALQMKKAIVPIQAGVLSALGMLVAPPGRQLSRTVNRSLNDCEESMIVSRLVELEEIAYSALVEEGFSRESMQSRRKVDVCYQGQSSTLTLPWSNQETIEKQFHALHCQRYGHELNSPLQLVNVRVDVNSDPYPIEMPKVKVIESDPVFSQVYSEQDDVAVINRESLAIDCIITGPVIIVDAISTVYVQRGWQLKRNEYGNLLLNKII